MKVKTELARQIMEAFGEDERTRDATIDAVDNNGVITLVGTAPTDESRAAAIEIAEKQPGVTTVIGDITLSDSEDKVNLAAAALGTRNLGPF